ncbi:tRNA preQ1(34) S-adenosylmethionine ribosyltransferase-isomerase QueA [Phycisphaera mikurensis]|uniref:S-adenosylmethionine:tRNA ribosyltransferase-isomerase n=1 Tax=Phycisphaera mikurensis (strain NBRC 102666 / KCTC 22515 / FYK2301M01) TaxID=1142394 RepID=I0IDY4_PHYMF|nr:tRNA preQ1(34) S-adenosylmethionine ribosyltransferase-isomerase QueA [Phycisphaera mikurensis]MBB6441279.1 S-adenosylmethionine:tRNA ribosyltransferase-isomerase [Phycisphaera mikurensis]BAM03472.1 S-adenosylmethionine--tRNA ribosyltransferase-isomerase [Phycisphaera mikurensis NBRC 102666]
MRTDELDFHLPERLIATTAAEPRDSARLMVCDRATGSVHHRRVSDLPGLGLVGDGDLMVVNRTAVLPARFEATRAGTGGRVTGLYLGHDDAGLWTAMLKSGGRPRIGERLQLGDACELELLSPRGGGRWRLRPRDLAGEPMPIDASLEVLRRVGLPPLPPYLLRARERAGGPADLPGDAERYQTVFADRSAASQRSVAAPTAGLHLTEAVLAGLRAAGVRTEAVTLEVGPGTFLPVRADELAEHPMHAERWHAPAATLDALRASRAAGGRVLAIGTTSVRTLESLPFPLPEPAPTAGLAGETDLFIRPDAGFAFRNTDLLLTNFHLPRSTLLALVAALPGVGLDRLLGWYEEAIGEAYRFYSFGDAMVVV